MPKCLANICTYQTDEKQRKKKANLKLPNKKKNKKKYSKKFIKYELKDFTWDPQVDVDVCLHWNGSSTTTFIEGFHLVFTNDGKIKMYVHFPPIQFLSPTHTKLALPFVVPKCTCWRSYLSTKWNGGLIEERKIPRKCATCKATFYDELDCIDNQTKRIENDTVTPFGAQSICDHRFFSPLVPTNHGKHTFLSVCTFNRHSFAHVFRN